MKVKIEIDMSPDEVQDLFIPSDKQKEFAQAMYAAYVDAMTKAASGAVKNTVGKIFGNKEK
jgi:hypothetical protein